jgi:hypothetical protein
VSTLNWGVAAPFQKSPSTDFLFGAILLLLLGLRPAAGVVIDSTSPAALFVERSVGAP